MNAYVYGKKMKKMTSLTKSASWFCLFLWSTE